MWVEILEGGEIKLDEGNGKIHTKISPSGLLISVSIHGNYAVEDRAICPETAEDSAHRE